MAPVIASSIDTTPTTIRKLRMGFTMALSAVMASLRSNIVIGPSSITSSTPLTHNQRSQRAGRRMLITDTSGARATTT